MPKLSGKEDRGGRNMKPCRTGLGRIKVEMIILQWLVDTATVNSIKLSGTLDIARFQAASINLYSYEIFCTQSDGNRNTTQLQVLA